MKLPPSLIPNIFSNLVTALTTGLLKGITVSSDAKKTKLNYSVNVDNSSIKVNEDNNLEIIESDPIFSAWDKSTGINITESQISDLKEYLTEETDPIFSASQAANITSGDITKLSNLSGVNTGDQDLSGKQDTLVSGTNIKTINSTSLLGSGDIVIAGGASSFKYGYYTLSSNQTTDISSGSPVKLDTRRAGSLPIPTNYQFTLEAGKAYKFLFTGFNNGACYYYIKDITNNAVLSSMYTICNGGYTPCVLTVITPVITSNTVYRVEMYAPSGTTIIINSETFLLIEEYGGY